MLEPLHPNDVLRGVRGRLFAVVDQKPTVCRVWYWEGCVCLNAVHPFQFIEVVLCSGYTMSNTWKGVLILRIFCQNTAQKIIRNNVLSVCLRMHTFRSYDVT